MRRFVTAFLLATACTPSLDGELHRAGDFSSLQAFTAEGQGFAAALRDAHDGTGRLTLVSLGTGASCEAMQTARYFPRRGPGDALGLFAHTSEGLEVVDASCRPLLEPIDVAPPCAVHEGIFGGDFRHHLLVETEDEELLLVQPWAGEVSFLSDGPAHAWRWVGLDRAWIHDGDRLVLRALSGEEQRVVGDGVDEVTWTAEGTMVFSDHAGLWSLATPEATPTRLADAACELRTLAGRETVAYLSPCEARRLVVHELGGAAVAIAEGVADYRHDTGSTFYSLGDDSDEGALYVVAGAEAAFVSPSALLSSVRRISHHGDTAHLFLSAEGVLKRFGSAGVESLHSGVSRFDVRHGHAAVLTDVAESGGTLLLRDDDREKVDTLAHDVPLQGFGFATQLRAFAFISGSRGGAGDLEVVVFQTGDRLTVDHDVTELAELRSDVQPGLAYIVGAGERRGIWFATVE